MGNDAIEVLKAMAFGTPEGTGLALASFSCRPEDVDADYEQRKLKDKYAFKAWTAKAVVYGRIGGIRPEALANCNSYVCVSAFGPYQGRDGALMPVTHGKKLARRKENWKALTAIMIDDLGNGAGAVDAKGRPKTRFTEPEELPLEPSWLIETSPGCYQAWYLLNTPETDFAIAHRFIEDLIAHGVVAKDETDRDKGGGMAGLTRYGRLPIGINNKRGQNWQVRILDDTFKRYTLEELAEAFGLPDPRRPIEAKRAGHAVPITTSAQIAPRFRIIPQVLGALGLFQSRQAKPSGWHDIYCPWAHEHGHAGDTGAAYKLPSLTQDGSPVGAFTCHHSACNGRRITDLADFCDQIIIHNKQRDFNE